MNKKNLLPRTARASSQRIEEETKRIKWLMKMKRLDHLPGTVELAIELHYERGFCSTAIINSGVVGEGLLNIATHNFRRKRPLHQIGALNTLRSFEVLELRQWINLKILRHEQPRVSEVQHAVYFFPFNVTLFFQPRPKE
jgi:hypothetical protein